MTQNVWSSGTKLEREKMLLQQTKKCNFWTCSDQTVSQKHAKKTKIKCTYKNMGARPNLVFMPDWLPVQ